MPPLPASGRHGSSALRVLLQLTAAIFLVEVLIMLAVPPAHPHVRALLDAAALCVVLVPLLYYAVYRPSCRHIAEQVEAQGALRESQRRLNRFS